LKSEPVPGAFIFDLDGTLVNSLPDIQANLNRALVSLGYDSLLSLEETRPYVGGGARKLAAGVLGKPMDHAATTALYQAFTDIYTAHPADFSRPFPGVMKVLKTLKQRSIPMACVTAKPAKARVQVLDALGLTPYLVCALSPEDGFAAKPAPDMLIKCCRTMGTAPSETVMVGDTRFDIEAGFNAGCIAVCHCTFGYQELAEEFAGRVIRLEHFTDVLELLKDD